MMKVHLIRTATSRTSGAMREHVKSLWVQASWCPTSLTKSMDTSEEARVFLETQKEGYFNNDHLLKQVDHTIDIFEHRFIDYVTGIGNGAFRASGPCCAQNAFV